jgi:hypothetical protein
MHVSTTGGKGDSFRENGAGSENGSSIVSSAGFQWGHVTADRRDGMSIPTRPEPQAPPSGIKSGAFGGSVNWGATYPTIEISSAGQRGKMKIPTNADVDLTTAGAAVSKDLGATGNGSSMNRLNRLTAGSYGHSKRPSTEIQRAEHTMPKVQAVARVVTEAAEHDGSMILAHGITVHSIQP